MDTTRLVAFAAFCSFALVAEAQGPATTVPLRPKPAHYHIPLGWEQHVVTVKFRDGLRIRLRAGRLVDLDGTAALAAAQPVLDGMRGTWSRTHTVAESELDRLRAIGEHNIGAPLPDLNLQFRCQLPADVDAATAIDALNALDCVELAESIPGLSPLPQAPDMRAEQGYQEPTPRGTGSGPFHGFADNIFANHLAATGAQARICDIEYGFDALHQDLPPVTPLTPQGWSDPTFDAHGTAVMGELLARDDGVGTTGIAPAAQPFFASARTPADPSNPYGLYAVDSAITTAATMLGSGAILLVEQQLDGGPHWTGAPNSQIGMLPVEWHTPTWAAIQFATAMGVIVVEAAGNGSENLDHPDYSGWFAVTHDSGALLVGAGAAPGGSGPAHSRLAFANWGSNYGATLDVQGWGEQIVTTGYGDRFGALGPHAYYTQIFGGTSGASPIVAGACALIQSLYMERFGPGSGLLPAAMRAALRRSGRPQPGFPFAPDNIGPLPDVVRTAMELQLYRGLLQAHDFDIAGTNNGLDNGGFGSPNVFAMVEFDDDGPGPHEPALYVAGQFTKAGGVPANNIARWNGAGWSALGTGLTLAGPIGFTGVGLALVVHDPDGTGPQPPALYVGGIFDHAGGIATNGIARWDGQAWSGVGGSGTNIPGGNVFSLCVLDEDGAGPLPPSLIVGGDFTGVGAVAALRVARWRNNAWSALGSGFDNRVEALVAYDADGSGPAPLQLIAGGVFQHSGAQPARSLAVWTGGSWQEFGGGTAGSGDEVRILTTVPVGTGQHRDLYVGGGFSLAAAPSTDLGIWNGSGWSVAPPISQPQAIAVFDDGLDTNTPLHQHVYIADGYGAVTDVDAVAMTTRFTPILANTVNCLHAFDADGPGGQPPALFVGAHALNGPTTSTGIGEFLANPPMTLSGQVTTVPTGCGGTFQPTIAATGRPALGRTFTVQFESLPLSVQAILFGPPETSYVPVCPSQASCVLGVRQYDVMVGASQTFGVPNDPLLLGIPYALQGVEVGALPYGAYCTAPYVPFTLRATDTLLVTL